MRAIKQHSPRTCMYCKTADTPQWRRGPDGSKSYALITCTTCARSLIYYSFILVCAMHVACIFIELSKERG